MGYWRLTYQQASDGCMLALVAIKKAFAMKKLKYEEEFILLHQLRKL